MEMLGPSRLPGWGGAARIIRLSLALDLALLFSGCHSELWPGTEQVSPGVIDDIRSLGTIVAEESSEITWDGLTTITNVFVVDVNGSAATPSLNRAMDLLEEHGWESTHDRRPTSVAMLSSRLDASIYMEGFDDDAVSSPIGLAAKTADLAKKAQAKNSAERFLVIEASPYDVE